MNKLVAALVIVIVMLQALSPPVGAQEEVPSPVVSSATGFWPSPPVPLADFAAAADVAGIVSAENYSRSLDAPVLRLYQAYFNRQPDPGGAKYWLTIRRQGFGLLDIAGFMAGSQEFADNYAGTRNADYVARVYTNVLGRAYDQAGYDYWLDLLNTNQTSRVTTVFYVTANTEFINNHPYTTAPPDELSIVARNYLGGVSRGEDATAFAQTGSVAFAYAAYLSELWSIFGSPPVASESTYEAQGAEYVFDGFRIRYDNIVMGAGGVASFDINGTSINELLLFSATPQGSAKVTVEYLSGYRAVSGGFNVVAQIRNNGDTSLDVAAYDAAWVSADGGVQHEPQTVGGSTSIRPGAVGTVVILYAPTGANTSAGTIYFESFLNNFTESVSYSATLAE